MKSPAQSEPAPASDPEATAAAPKESSATRAIFAALTVLCALQALALIAITVMLVIDLASGVPTDSLQSAIGIIVLTVIVAAFLAGATFGVARRKRWVQAPLLVWDALLAVIGLAALVTRSARPLIAAALLMMGIVMVALLLVRPTQEAFGPRGGSDRAF